MPNHFHLMVYVNHTQLMNKKTRTFSDSIGIILRSYTRAINNQEIRTGSLFKPHTKSNCLNGSEGISPTFFNTAFGTSLNVSIPEKEYPQVCWNYIHNNPLSAGLVSRPEDWEFSSYRDYFCGRDGKLINKERAKEFGLYSSGLYSSDDFTR
jgi:putative transposase